MWRGHAISFYKGILPKIQRIFGDKTVFTITFDKMLEFVSFSLRIARFLQLVPQTPISAILLALWRYGLWPYCHNMALWPYAPYCHMATNMANMGVYGTSNRNVAFQGENETNLSMLSKVIAKTVLYQKILCIFGKIPL